MELKRPVHHRVVLIALAFIKEPREIGMQTFIVTHHARAEIVEARCECHQDDGGEYRYFICDCGQSRMNGAFKPGTWVVFVGSFVGHSLLRTAAFLME